MRPGLQLLLVLERWPTEEQRAGLTSLLLPCSSNMKRAASLNYLNQPNAAPLQVRVLRVTLVPRERGRTPQAAPGAAGKVEDLP